MKLSPHQRQAIETNRTAARARWQAGRPGEAEGFWRAVLAIDPRDADALEGLGLAASGRGQRDEAKRWFEKSHKADPARPTARINLADMRLHDGAFREALTLARPVIAKTPGHAVAHFITGQAQLELGDTAAGLESLRTAAGLSDPVGGHIEGLVYSRIDVCDWRDYETLAGLLLERLRSGRPIAQPALPMLICDDPADLATAARAHARWRCPPQPALAPTGALGEGRIRLGYVTGEMHDHPVAQVFAGVLEHHDREVFELFCFSHGPARPDEIRTRLGAGFEHFVDVSQMSDEQIARTIAQCRIDIAVTLSGYTSAARPGILTHRPAPAQVSYIGWPGTLGSPCIDWLIADCYVIPPGAEADYDEAIARLPNSYHASTPAPEAPASPPTRAAEGLPEHAFVFMAYNQPRKIAPARFAAWMRIIARVPASVLWLSDGGDEAKANLRREAQGAGIDPDRLVFAADRPARADHLARNALADLFIDTAPYNAHSTALDALRAGLPVITQRGQTFPGRVCAGFLEVAGLADLITEDLSSYEELAVALALDPVRLAAIRARVAAAATSPLFDSARYTQGLETALQTIHRMTLAGESPRSFSV